MEVLSEDKCATLKDGVSGIMRVKNDAEFVEMCIDSCIDALDELVIVYNECSDNTPALIEKKRLQYPDKIKVYEYKYKVYAVNLSKEEYEYVLGLPDDSPHLLSNYYNFALSKVSYKYAVKIDADQLYFTSQLKKWCDICRGGNVSVNYIWYVLGFLFNLYFVCFKYLCFKTNKVFPLLPLWCVQVFYPFYLEYVKVQVRKGKACLSLSGVNVIKDGEKWYVSLGYRNDVINILPPFNGEGDHLIFKVSVQTYYEKFSMPYYNLLTSGRYSLIESFVHPYKTLCVGFSWFHLNAMREKCRNMVLQVKSKKQNCFMELNQFLSKKYEYILNKIDKDMCTNRQCTLFMFIFKSDSTSLKQNISFLKKYDSNK